MSHQDRPFRLLPPTAACLALLAVTAAPGRAVELARGGRTAYVISVPDDAAPAEQLAAREVAGYLQRITGAGFPVRAGARPRKAIVIAPGGAPGSPRRENESYRIALRGETLYLAGRGRGALYAAYDFLERLGCRWLAPGFGFYDGAHEVIPSRPRLSFDLPADVVEKPELAFRKLYVEEGHSHDAANLAQIVAWMPKARYNTLVVPTDYQGRGTVRWDNWREKLTPELQRRGLIIEVGGHGYQNFLNARMEDGKLFERHPEWFGQDAAGTRRREIGRVFCTSNAAARDFVIRSFLAYVKERPEIRIFDFWPPDGARWCECPSCAAIGTPSERHALLMNQVKTAAAKVRPDLRLECIAYSSYVRPPEKERLDRDILLDFCPINQRFQAQIDDPSEPANAEYARALEAWRKAFAGDISVYSYYRKYAWRSLPAVDPKYIQDDLRWYRKLPVQGLSTYAEPGDWGTYELNHYALGRLAWRPDLDVEALVDEFCASRYGPAAREAKTLVTALAKAERTVGGIPFTRPESPAQVAGFREQVEAAAGKLRAADAAGAFDAGRQRLLLVAEYVLRDLRIQELRAGKAKREELRKPVEELAAFLAAHGDRGTFLMHSRLTPARLLESYGVLPRRRAAE